VSIGVTGGVMAEERKAMAVKLTVEAIEAAKIAAAFKGMNLMQYASEVLLDAATRDIEEGYRLRSGGQHGSEAGRRKPKPKGSD
jgi:hypothetical protein